FPTDAQPMIMAALCKAKGTSMFVENIFENRYKHVDELVKMGADIKAEGKVAVVEGVDRLFGTTVNATDLRGGAALVIAGLAAEGITTISNISHIDRGYDEIEKALSSVGANVVRI
ncbi:MAG TPA: UDP-N-acetylglucosamine 1-carboxyvinyltransferase, partial [Oscillospiraceae bacterium]|nr:UDP-N-acetylglucosamine 1-carboxyvinyltransferase [Oscillospiraceae bacterium]